jgi:hypothetical protein
VGYLDQVSLRNITWASEGINFLNDKKELEKIVKHCKVFQRNNMFKFGWIYATISVQSYMNTKDFIIILLVDIVLNEFLLESV